jgi:hypothetical protein
MKASSHRMFRVGMAVLVLIAGMMNAAVAQGSGTSIRPWAALTPHQQEALAPLASDWSSIDAARQKKWLDVAGRFKGMDAEERERVQRRMGDWAALTPSQRGQARLTFQELRAQTAPDERQSRWQAYQALPESQRRELAKRGTAAATAQPQTHTKQKVDGLKSAVVKPTDNTKSPRVVGPSVVQGGPGATTNLVSRFPTPPEHVKPGAPKIAAKPGMVDPKTLLPKRAPQGAAAVDGREPAADAH